MKEENIASLIFFIRGEKVILDSHLALMYGVETKRFKEAVRRNIDRFPGDFMFELSSQELAVIKTSEETLNLRPQIASSSWGGSRYHPMVFTEQGVAMLSGVLRSKRAVEVNISIMRTFVHMRRLMEGNKELARKIKELELLTNERLTKHDEKFRMIFEAIRQLIQNKNEPRKKIGYKP